MSKRRRKVNFPSLAVYAVSPRELARCLQAVENLVGVVSDLVRLAGDLRDQVNRLQAVPTPRKRKTVQEVVDGDLAAINRALLDEGGG